MQDKSEMLVRFSERIRAVTSSCAGLDAREVASILAEIQDVETRRMILAKFLSSACRNGNVSEVVAWAVVMSHMEGRRPAKDVQEEAKYLINAH